MSEEKKEELSIKGRVVIILPEENINKKDGSVMIKKQFVIETEGQYPKKVSFQAISEKVNVPKIGTLCDIKFNIESREYQGRWYPQITAWAIREDKNSAPSNAIQNNQSPQAYNGDDNNSDELPF
jgi:hypothetical protein